MTPVTSGRTSALVITLTLIVAFPAFTGCATCDTSKCPCPQSENCVPLFNGKNLTGWKAMQPDRSTWQACGAVELGPIADHQELVIKPGTGLLVNGAKGSTSNLFTEFQHGDCRAHIEFMVPKGSNSGVYFMGKYEVQILDSYGKKDVDFGDCCGIYARWIDNKNVDGHAPRVNASKAPGEWQTCDVIFKAPRFDDAGKKIANAMFVKVIHNGKVVHENVELKGPTRSGMPGPETAKGPIMLQGDHGPVAYRNIRIRPLH